MAKSIHGNRNVSFAKVFAFAIMFSMALSAVPMAQAQDACGCGPHDACASHAACECGHCHAGETCDCCHDACCHCQDGNCCVSGHHEGGPGTAQHSHDSVMAPGSAGDFTVLSEPAHPETSGFPVWLDQSQTGEDGEEACGLEQGVMCPNCAGLGTLPCTCGGTGNETCGDCIGGWIDCTDCDGGWVDCTSCVGGYNDCTDCGGDGLITCTFCDGFGDIGTGPQSCTYCDGYGNLPCTNPQCIGGQIQCMMCTGAGGWICMMCSGNGGWDCPTCEGDGIVTCSNCGGAGNLGPCGNCGGDGSIELNHQLAQEFVPATTGQVDRVRIMIYNPDAYASDLRVYLCDNASSISDTVSIPGTAIDASPQWVDVEFHDSVVLTSGKTYYIVAEADEYKWWWNTNSMDPYPSGSAWSATSDFDWAPLPGVDMAFEVYMTTIHTKIYDVYDLQDMSLNLTGNYLLMNDIDASETQYWNGGQGFEPIGSSITPFTGALEGDGHMIYLFNINRPGKDYVGLFGAIGTGAKVNDTGMRRVNITGQSNIGSIAGYNLGDISNCSTTGWLWGTQNNVGGLVGWNSNPGRIGYSWSYCRVEGDNYVGGLVGDFSGLNCILAFSYSRGFVIGNNYVGGLAGITDNNGALVAQSYSSADVTCSGECAGGLSGFNYCEIRNCYATGDVDGNDKAGGFIGWNDYDIYMCYSSGHVTGTTLTDGFIGYMDTGSTANCYYDTQTSGYPTGNYYGDPQTTAALMTQSTYVMSWNFTSTWWMVDGHTRPFLRWEHSTEIFNSHELQMMQMDLTADYKLMNNTDLSDTCEATQMWGTSPTTGLGFYPVANAGTFSGTFSGGNFTISNLFINWVASYEGLFGYAGIGSVIRDVSLTGLDLIVGDNSGGIVANSAGDIINCHTEGTINGLNTVGGITGTGEGSVSDCSSSVVITGTDNVGGIIGYSDAATVTHCTAAANASVITFGTLNTGGLIGNCVGGTVTNCSSSGVVSGYGSLGGLIGSSSGVISDCESSATVTALGWNSQGGLIGLATAGPVTRCKAYGDVHGLANVGGLIGQAQGGLWTVSQCFATGDIYATSSSNAGLIGYQNFIHIVDCYARGDVHGGFALVGGLVGFGYGDITNCYSTGAVSCSGVPNALGGFVGQHDSGTFTNCHWDTTTSGTTDGDGNSEPDPAGITGHATAQMMQQATFAGWDFTNVWGIWENYDYPILMAVAKPDLEITLDYDPSPWVTVGQEFNYRIFITNHGPEAALGMDVHLVLPESCSYTGYLSVVPTVAGRYVNWSFPGMLPSLIYGMGVSVLVNYYEANITCNADVESVFDDPGEYPNSASVTSPVNRPPNAANDNYATNENTPISGWLVGNDNDPDGAFSGAYSYDFTGTKGAVTTWWPDTNGTFYYDPRGSAELQALDVGQTLNDYFNYTISDGRGGFDTAMATITVTGVNDAPVITTSNVPAAAVNAAYSVDYNATDAEGDTLTWAVQTNATWLTMGWATGVLAGTPTVNESGRSFWVNVSVNDGNLTDWTNFTLTIGIDSDGDGIPDLTDPDDDNDGVPDTSDDFPLDPDEWADTDGDGTGDNADTDDDGDGVPDASDDFPLDSDEWVDTDGDGTGDNADTDDDGDGVPDTSDDFPLDPDEDTDTDGDGIGNNADTDDDGDGVLDVDDDLPLDDSETVDTDGDGIGNNADTDDDGDGVPDTTDAFPLDPDEWVDTDGDGIGNNADTDDDGDGVLDVDDDLPLDDSETVDTDGDGIGNNADTDDDGDGVPDATDDFPLDPDEWVDTDGDGIGNNADDDDDGDGILDINDDNPLVPDDSGSGDEAGGIGSGVILILVVVLVIVGIGAAIALKPKAPKPPEDAPPQGKAAQPQNEMPPPPPENTR